MTLAELHQAYMEAWIAYIARLHGKPTPEERRRAFKVVEGGKAA
jgi:hypothetical protein